MGILAVGHHHVVDIDPIAVPQQVPRFDPAAVDKRAVQALQVLDESPCFVAHNAGMLPRNGLQRNDDAAAGVAAEHGFRRRQQKRLPGVHPLENTDRRDGFAQIHGANGSRLQKRKLGCAHRSRQRRSANFQYSQQLASLARFRRHLPLDPARITWAVIDSFQCMHPAEEAGPIGTRRSILTQLARGDSLPTSFLRPVESSWGPVTALGN